MNRKEHLLAIASEECDETSQRCLKAARFGIDEIQQGQSMTNAERIIYEYSHLVAMIELLRDEGYIHFGADFHYNVEEKKRKVEQWLLYSREQGTLSD